MDWKSFTLLYQRPECLQRLQDLVQDYSGKTKPNDKHSSAVNIIQLPEGNNFRFVRFLRRLKNSYNAYLTNIHANILDRF